MTSVHRSSGAEALIVDITDDRNADCISTNERPIHVTTFSTASVEATRVSAFQATTQSRARRATTIRARLGKEMVDGEAGKLMAGAGLARCLD